MKQMGGNPITVGYLLILIDWLFSCSFCCVIEMLRFDSITEGHEGVVIF